MLSMLGFVVPLPFFEEGRFNISLKDFWRPHMYNIPPARQSTTSPPMAMPTIAPVPSVCGCESPSLLAGVLVLVASAFSSGKYSPGLRKAVAVWVNLS